MSLQRASTEQVFRRSLATTALSIFSVHQLSGSCGWPSLSRGLLGGHSFLCRKYPPNFPGIRVGTGHYFFKKTKDVPSTLARFTFIPARQDEKKNLVWFSDVPRMTFKQGVGCELRVERDPGHGRWRTCHPSPRLAPIWHTSSGNLNQAPTAGTDPVQVRRIRLLWEFFLPYSLAACFNYK